jgi:hypothetical protein
MIDKNPIPILVIRHRKLKAQADALKSQMDEIKAELKPLVEAEGGKWTDGTGYARIIQRKSSVSYNVKALEALRESVPEIAQVIEPHRKERPGSRYLQVK